MQCMHLGSYDDELKTVDLMRQFAEENSYEIDLSKKRLHHEIYLSDPRRCEVSKLRTVIRHPVKKVNVGALFGYTLNRKTRADARVVDEI